MKGGRKLSEWNLFVKKIYKEGKEKNSNYKFKNALEEASRRKSEMANSKKGGNKSKKTKKSNKNISKRRREIAGGKTKKHRKS
jgi:hypothetical protein